MDDIIEKSRGFKKPNLFKADFLSSSIEKKNQIILIWKTIEARNLNFFFPRPSSLGEICNSFWVIKGSTEKPRKDIEESSYWIPPPFR